MRISRLLATALVASAIAGCQLAADSVSPSASLSPHVQAARDFRMLYGLEHDMTFIQTVARDPTAQDGVREFGVPLLPDEVAELKSRGANATRIMSTVQTYGERHHDEWAGAFLDTQGAGDVVVQFSGHRDEHERALRALVGPAARLDVRGVRWSLADLEHRLATVEADQRWLRSIDAWFESAVVNEMANRVDLSVSSANPAVGQLAMDHFAGTDWLHVMPDGIGHWKGGYGSLEVLLVDERGDPVVGQTEPWKCRLDPAVPSAWAGGSLAVANGKCVSDQPLGATIYHVIVTRPGGDGAEVVAEGNVAIPVDGTGHLRLVVPSG